MTSTRRATAAIAMTVVLACIPSTVSATLSESTAGDHATKSVSGTTLAQRPPGDTTTLPQLPLGALAWVYKCDTNQTEWDDLVDYLNTSAKPAGLTSVSICAYRIKADGSFGYQDTPYGPARCGQNQEAQVPKIRATGLRQYPLIDCHAGIDAVRLMMATKTSRATFITAAVSKMKEQGFDGYNLDIELGGTPADAVLYTDFVNEFSDALHTEGGALSSDVGSCGGRDYIGMRCADDYRPSMINGVMTMSTYTHSLDAFKADVASGMAALGDKYVVGVDTGSNGSSYFEHLSAVNVTRVALWACGVAGCFNPAFLDAMRLWSGAVA